MFSEELYEYSKTIPLQKYLVNFQVHFKKGGLVQLIFKFKLCLSSFQYIPGLFVIMNSNTISSPNSPDIDLAVTYHEQATLNNRLNSYITY